MRIIKDEKVIKRNAMIGQYTSFAALAVLGVGMYISFQRQDLFIYSIGALLLGFTMTQVGMYFSNRFGRRPRPDEQLDAALKGLPGENAIYHYVTPVPHLLVSPAGVWVLHTYHQRGNVSYSRNRWRLSGGGFMQAYMSLFGQEGIGRPDLDIANETASVKKYLAKKMEESEIPEVQGVLVFSNEEAQIDPEGGPIPALKAKQLKDFIRQKSKERPLGSMTLEHIRAALPPEE